MNEDRAATWLIVLLLLVVLAAVLYSVVMNARVASALRQVDDNLAGGVRQIEGWRDWLRRLGLRI